MAGNGIRDLLNQKLGLDSNSIGHLTLDRVVQRRMAQQGILQEEEYLQKMLVNEAELQELIEAVVVPETWFYRDEAAFEALGSIARDRWLNRASSTPLKLMSFPCSTGEEPYSMAMTLLDVGLGANSFVIHAMDVSHKALDRACAAVYGRNSFRGANATRFRHYFSEVDGGLAVNTVVRGLVEFRQANLLEVGKIKDDPGYDVIFCRNLLIYADQEGQAKIVGNLRSLLSQEGYLFVGSAEAFLVREQGFLPVHEAGAFAFRMEPNSSPSDPALPTLPARKTPAKRGTGPTLAPPPPNPPPPNPPPLNPPPGTPQVSREVKKTLPTLDLGEATRLADGGQLPQAAILCEKLLEAEPGSVAVHLLLGLVRDALGQAELAAACYRKVLYLNPSHTDALTHLALLLEKQGDPVGARRLRDRGKRHAQRDEL